MFQGRRGAGDGHWRTRVSMQEVIERDRRVPECHTWHWVIRGDLGLAGPYLSLPESPARTCPPSHSSVQREDSAVWKLCTCGSASEKKSTRARRAVQVLILWCACVGYAHTCFLRGGRNSWFQKEVSHYQQEHRHVCLWKTKQSVVSLSYTPVWPLGGSVCFLYWHNTCASRTSAAPQMPAVLLWNLSFLCVAELV